MVARACVVANMRLADMHRIVASEEGRGKQKVNASRISIWWLKFRCHHALGVGLFLARRSVARSLPTVWVRAKFAVRRRCCSLRSPRPGRPNRSPTLRRYPVSSRSNGGRATRMPLPEANKRARPRWAFAAEHPPPPHA